MRVAAAFAELQEERHRADYDLTAVLTRSDARNAVTRARSAIADWETTCNTAPARLFLLLMLTGSSVIQTR